MAVPVACICLSLQQASPAVRLRRMSVSMSAKILVTMFVMSGSAIAEESADANCASNAPLRMRHIRSATFVLDIGKERLLVDPMLADVGTLKAMPGVSGLKIIGSDGRKNPLVPLPPNTDEILEGVTGVLITHVHPDHLDPDGKAWIKERNLPVWTSGYDVEYLRSKGLDAKEIRDGSMGLRVEVVPCQHGRGVVGWVAGVGAGYFLTAPGQASIYITGDTVITPEVSDVLARLAPDVVVAPAGAANFGFGADLLFTVEELKQLIKLVPGKLVFYHLETLDHCPTTREFLREMVKAEGADGKTLIPDDGEELAFENSSGAEPKIVSKPLPGLGSIQQFVMHLSVDI